jgi:hypothetical protein
LVLPVHLRQLGRLDFPQPLATFLDSASLVLLVLALCVGGVIIIGAMVRGYRAEPAGT